MEQAALQTRFDELKQQWKKETAALSSVTAILLNKNYLSIIALGPVVVPLILKDLAEDLDHWFLALEVLTGHVIELPGNKNMTDHQAAWLAWGKEHFNAPPPNA
jgi:hypothetical protein